MPTPSCVSANCLYEPRDLHRALTAALADPILSKAQKHVLSGLIASACARSLDGLRTLTEEHHPEFLGPAEWTRLLRSIWRASRSPEQRSRFLEWLGPQIRQHHRTFLPICLEFLEAPDLPDELS
jgi:hypothetical protein